MVPKAQDADSASFQCLGPLNIVAGLRRLGMLAAVQLDSKPGLVTVKVEDVRANRMLPTEFPAVQLAIA